MARKSRKNVDDNIESEIITPIYIAGAYLRVSVEDKHQQNSIAAQESMICNFIKKRGDIRIYKTYIDNGVSAFDKNRPAFDDMISDVRLGKINTVIVKDISRFGREYIQVGEYIETIFPFLNIRFISLFEPYDSLINQPNIQLGLKNIVNYHYSIDISQKVKSSLKIKITHGEYIAAKLPYGYGKEKQGRGTKWVVDEATAKVAKDIFDYTYNGMSTYKLAGLLNSSNTPSPGGKKWTPHTIKTILSNSAYIGNFVAQKSTNNILADRRTEPIPKKDWLVIPNHHAAIVDKFIFEAVQKFLDCKSNVVRKSALEEDFFNNTLYCGYCGRKMKRKKSRSPYNGFYYVCPAKDEAKDSCKNKSGNPSIIKKELFNSIQKNIENAVAFKSKAIAYENSILYKLRQQNESKKLNRLKESLSCIKNAKFSVYSAYGDKQISSIDYWGYYEYFSDAQSYSKKQINTITERQEEYWKYHSSKAEHIETLLKFKNETTLTENMISDLIKKVRVFRDNIEVCFNFDMELWRYED